MAALVFSRYVLECDGCHAQHGTPNGHGSALEARAAAHSDGWRYPATAKADGTPGSSTSDVCPACFPGWRPRSWGGRRSGRYVLQSDAPRES